MNHGEASEYLGMTKEGLYALVKQDKVPYYKRGRYYRYDRVRLDKWVEECHTEKGVTLEKAIENLIKKKLQRAREGE